MIIYIGKLYINIQITENNLSVAYYYNYIMSRLSPSVSFFHTIITDTNEFDYLCELHLFHSMKKYILFRSISMQDAE